jgi:signal transduction histidine kinase
MLNLLGNSVKFTKSGTITVKALLVRTEIELAQVPGTKYDQGAVMIRGKTPVLTNQREIVIRISIEDTGIGIGEL